MLVEADVRIQSRHADIDTRLARDIPGIGSLESAFVKHVFRQLDHVDVVMVAASHARSNETA